MRAEFRVTGVVVGMVALAGALAGADPRLGHSTDCFRVTSFSRSDLHGGWEQGPTGPAPRYTDMVYDAARQRTVLFGGGDWFGVRYGDTWFYDGVAWSQGPAGPPGREQHALAYDSNRQVVVMFGGYGGGGVHGDTWELGGLAWTQGPSGPPPRNFISLAFDVARGKTVLFGGWDGGAELDDTWEYDGSGWTLVTPAASPSARLGASLAYDAGRAVTVLVGGADDFGGVLFRDVWEYDGVTWTPGPDLPGWPRAEAGMVYVPTDGAVAILGGFAGGGSCAVGLQDLWFFDGTTWSPEADFPGYGRWDHGMSYDVPRDRIVVFGGGDYVNGVYGDTWEYGACSFAILPPTVPGGELGVPYQVTLTGSGGTSPYRFLAASPLPPGLTLTTGGNLSGTPTATGSFSFTVTATDATGCTGQQTFASEIHPLPEVAVGQGHGQPNPNRVRLFSATGWPTVFDVLAYGAGTWGANVACGRIEGTPPAQVLTGPGPGAVFGPQVRAFRHDGTTIAKVNFYAYGTLKYGVNVGSGDVVGGGAEEILTGGGPGQVFAPHVRGFSYGGTSVQALPGLSYFAYTPLEYGVNVAGGDIDGGVAAEILTAPGAGPPFGPQVRAFAYQGGVVRDIPAVSFFAGTTAAYGANVAGGDVDEDGFDEIAATAGPDPMAPSRFRGYDYDGVAVAAKPGFDVWRWGTKYGGRVGLAHVASGPALELLTGIGPDPAASSKMISYRYTGSLVQGVSFTPFSPGYGVNVAGGNVVP